MRYKKLGTTDMEVSELTIGTWAIGGAGWGNVDRKQSLDAIHRMVECGVNFIDTAPAYNFGAAECVVGEAIQSIRDKVFIATKGGVTNIGNRTLRDSSEANLLLQCEESLKRLNIDHLDLYMIHWPDYNVTFEETFTALEKLKKQGKIRHIGVSNFSLRQIFEAEKYGQIDVVQLPYSMVNRSQERFLKWFHDHKLGVMTWGSLGGGILTGAFRTVPKFAADDLRLGAYDSFVEPKFSKVMEILKTLDDIANAHSVPVAQVAINWNLKKEFVDTALVGVINPQQAEENCACMDWELSEDAMSIIDQKIDAVLGDQEVYCRQVDNPWAIGYRD